jgi:hypothetical protein
VVVQPVAQVGVEKLSWGESINGFDQLGWITSLALVVVQNLSGGEIVVLQSLDVLELWRNVSKHLRPHQIQLSGALVSHLTQSSVGVQPHETRIDTEAVQEVVYALVGNTNRVDSITESVIQEGSLNNTKGDELRPGGDALIEAQSEVDQVGVEIGGQCHIVGIMAWCTNIISDELYDHQERMIRGGIASKSHRKSLNGAASSSINSNVLEISVVAKVTLSNVFVERSDGDGDGIVLVARVSRALGLIKLVSNDCPEIFEGIRADFGSGQILRGDLEVSTSRVALIDIRYRYEHI